MPALAGHRRTHTTSLNHVLKYVIACIQKLTARLRNNHLAHTTSYRAHTTSISRAYNGIWYTYKAKWRAQYLPNATTSYHAHTAMCGMYTTTYRAQIPLIARIHIFVAPIHAVITRIRNMHRAHTTTFFIARIQRITAGIQRRATPLTRTEPHRTSNLFRTVPHTLRLAISYALQCADTRKLSACAYNYPFPVCTDISCANTHRVHIHTKTINVLNTR